MVHALRAVVVAVLVTTTGGCAAYENLTTSDFAQQEPGQVVGAASAAMSGLTSLRVTGQVRRDGVEMFVDLAMDDEGRCTGTLRTADGRVSLRQVGRRAWFTGEQAFFRRIGGASVPPGRLTHLSTSWVALDPGPAAGLCDLGRYEGGLAVPRDGGAGATKGEGKGEGKTGTKTGDLDGTRAGLDLVEDEELGDGVLAVHFSPRPDRTVWVLSQAPHHVVRMEQDGRDGGEIAFSDFGVPVDVEAPSPDEVDRG